MRFITLCVCLSAYLATGIAFSSNAFADLTTPTPSAMKAVYLTEAGSQRVGREVSYLSENSSRYDIQQVLQFADSQWQASNQDTVNLGIRGAPYWFKFNIQNKAIDLNWFLRLNYPPMDQIEIYTCPASPSKNECSYQKTGDSFKFSTRHRNNPNFIFPLPITEQFYSVYIRAETVGAYQMPLSITDEASLNRSLSNSTFLRGGYIGLMLVMMLYNFFIFTMTRSKTYLYYSLFVLSFLFFNATYEGTGFQYLWPNQPALNAYILPFAYSINLIFTTLFIIKFLDLKNTSKASYRYFSGLMSLGVIYLLLSPFVDYNTLVPYTVVTGAIVAASALTLGIRYWVLGRSAARFFTIAWAIFTIGFVLANLTSLAILPTNSITQYGYQVGSFLEVVLLSLALGERIQRLQNEKMHARKEMLAAKEESIDNLKLYEDLYQNSVSGQFQLNKDRDFTKTNPSFRRIIGFETEESFTDSEVSFPALVADEQILQQLFQRLSWQKQVRAYEVPLAHRDGRTVIASLTMRQSNSEQHGSGTHTNDEYYSASLIDITDKIQREQLHKKAQAERMTLLQQLVVGVSHEMNTPIGNIGLSESFLNELINEMELAVQNKSLTPKGLLDLIDQQREALNTVDASSQRLSELTKVFKSISINRIDYPLQTIDLVVFLNDWMESIEGNLNIELAAPNALESTCYPTALLIILQQLWRNSVEHNSQGSDSDLKISIELEKIEESVIFTFKDNGVGLTAEECEKIFLPFYTKSRGIKKKMGLGMYQSYNLITDLFTGTISAHPNEEKGLKIIIEFPQHISGEFSV